MSGTTVKFWEGRTPAPEYIAAIDPYKDQPSCKYDLKELSRYARKVGKQITELTNDEVARFST